MAGGTGELVVAAWGVLDTAMCQLFNALNCESLLFKSYY